MQAFVLGRTEAAQFGVPSLVVSENSDLLKHTPHGILGIVQLTVVGQFHFQASEGALRHGVVKAIGTMAHAPCQALLRQRLPWGRLRALGGIVGRARAGKRFGQDTPAAEQDADGPASARE